jgi:hypothetical protein
MYSIHPSVWVHVATHHFTHAAARLLQSGESEIQHVSWETFSNLIHERFSRDQHELLLRQLFHIKHTSTVSDYIDKFTDLYEQLKAYNPNPDKLYFTTRFVDGLCEDIRSVVMVSRPQDLDTACTLALLQEEALDQGSRQGIIGPCAANRVPVGTPEADRVLSALTQPTGLGRLIRCLTNY